MLTTRHHDDVTWHMHRLRATLALGDYRADDPAQEVASGVRLTAAR